MVTGIKTVAARWRKSASHCFFEIALLRWRMAVILAWPAWQLIYLLLIVCDERKTMSVIINCHCDKRLRTICSDYFPSLSCPVGKPSTCCCWNNFIFSFRFFNSQRNQITQKTFLTLLKSRDVIASGSCCVTVRTRRTLRFGTRG